MSDFLQQRQSSCRACDDNPASGMLEQDQYMEVRQTFGSKVHKTLLTLYNQPGSHNKAAKYVAMLSLAGMDPATANQQAASACLQQFVAVRRQVAWLASS